MLDGDAPTRASVSRRRGGPCVRRARCAAGGARGDVRRLSQPGGRATRRGYPRRRRRRHLLLGPSAPVPEAWRRRADGAGARPFLVGSSLALSAVAVTARSARFIGGRSTADGPVRVPSDVATTRTCSLMDRGTQFSANVTPSTCFLRPRCLVGGSSGWADGQRGATRQRESSDVGAF